MELNRNHYIIIGVVVLLIGLQLRVVESYVLTPDATRWLTEHFGDTASQAVSGAAQAISGTGPQQTYVPPEWLGWAAISLGSVLVLHSLALPRPS